MKISQEAREAAAEWAFLFFAGQATSEFEAAMQSLINSTLERAALEAIGYAYGSEAAKAIRKLIEE